MEEFLDLQLADAQEYVGEAYNKPAEHKNRVPICPVPKELAILDALKAFRMLTEDTEYKEADAI